MFPTNQSLEKDEDNNLFLFFKIRKKRRLSKSQYGDTKQLDLVCKRVLFRASYCYHV